MWQINIQIYKLCWQYITCWVYSFKSFLCAYLNIDNEENYEENYEEIFNQIIFRNEHVSIPHLTCIAYSFKSFACVYLNIDIKRDLISEEIFNDIIFRNCDVSKPQVSCIVYSHQRIFMGIWEIICLDDICIYGQVAWFNDYF